ncbi:MAG: molybdopterin converting factor subunit 1 [Thermoplasmatales archaeon]
MRLHIKYYAKYREAAGRKEEEIELDKATVSQLLDFLRTRYPGLKNEKSSIVAVNSRFAKEDDPLSEGDVVSIFPPVSGG